MWMSWNVIKKIITIGEEFFIDEISIDIYKYLY